MGFGCTPSGGIVEFLTEDELAGLERSRWAVQQKAAAEIRSWRRKAADMEATVVRAAWPGLRQPKVVPSRDSEGTGLPPKIESTTKIDRPKES